MAFVLPIDEFLKSAPGDSPCGIIDPTHDAQVSALLESIRGVEAKTRPTAAGGIEVIREGRDPDWRLLRESAEALFLGKEALLLSAKGATSQQIEWKPVKHLGVAMVLTLAALRTEGLSGLADGLELIARLLAEHWEALHPLPAVKSSVASPMVSKDRFYARGNLLSPLGAEYGALGDSWRFVECLFAASLIESRHYGNLSVRDCLSTRTFKPKLELPPGEAVTAEKVASARLDFAKELEGRQAVLRAAVKAAERIEKVFNEKAPDSPAPKLAQIIRVLKEAAAVLNSSPGTATAIEGESTEPEENPVDETEPGPVSGPGAIASREQAILMLTKVADYFALREPSSPIPQMIERVRRLAGMDFLGLLEELELAEEAVPAYKKLVGLRDGGATQSEGATPAEETAGAAPAE